MDYYWKTTLQRTVHLDNQNFALGLTEICVSSLFIVWKFMFSWQKNSNLIMCSLHLVAMNVGRPKYSSWYLTSSVCLARWCATNLDSGYFLVTFQSCIYKQDWLGLVGVNPYSLGSNFNVAAKFSNGVVNFLAYVTTQWLCIWLVSEDYSRYSICVETASLWVLEVFQNWCRLVEVSLDRLDNLKMI